MFKQVAISAFLALTTAFAAPVRAADLTADTVVATVNGHDIALGHMIATLQALPAPAGGQALK